MTPSFNGNGSDDLRVRLRCSQLSHKVIQVAIWELVRFWVLSALTENETMHMYVRNDLYIELGILNVFRKIDLSILHFLEVRKAKNKITSFDSFFFKKLQTDACLQY